LLPYLVKYVFKKSSCSRTAWTNCHAVNMTSKWKIIYKGEKNLGDPYTSIVSPNKLFTGGNICFRDLSFPGLSFPGPFVPRTFHSRSIRSQQRLFMRPFALTGSSMLLSCCLFSENKAMMIMQRTQYVCVVLPSNKKAKFFHWKT